LQRFIIEKKGGFIEFKGGNIEFQDGKFEFIGGFFEFEGGFFEFQGGLFTPGFGIGPEALFLLWNSISMLRGKYHGSDLELKRYIFGIPRGRF
jgi:hypothetical protein